MVGRRTSAQVGDYTFPATTGTVGGIVGLGMVGLLIVVIAFDGWGLAGVRTQIGLLIFGVLTWALMLRPRILVRGGVLRLVNPFHTISMPLHLVDSVQVVSVTKVHVGSRTYVGIAVGRKTRELVRPAGYGAPGGPFSIRLRDDETGAAPREKTADLLEQWVNQAAADARREAKRGGAPDQGDANVVRTTNRVLLAVLGALVAALVVSLVV